MVAKPTAMHGPCLVPILKLLILASAAPQGGSQDSKASVAPKTSPSVLAIDDHCFQASEDKASACAVNALQKATALLSAKALEHGEAAIWPFDPAPSPSPNLAGKVWEACQGCSEIGSYPFPEQDTNFGLTKRTKNVGIAFAGGGCRTYAAGYGQLHSLLGLGLLNQTRYLSGTSGGAWLGTIYTYSQTSASEQELLALVANPADLTLAQLKELPKTSLGYATSQEMLLGLIKGAAAWIAKGRPSNVGEIWANALGDAMLAPYGLNTDQFFVASEGQANNIIARNPHLTKDDFVTPRSGVPFLIMEITEAGPIPEKCLVLPPQQADNETCLNPFQKSFRLVEATPLYTGNALGREVPVVYGNDAAVAPVLAHTGGLKESVVVNSAAPAAPFRVGQAGADYVVDVPAPPFRWSLKQASAASSMWGGMSRYWIEAGPRPGRGTSVETSTPIANTVTQPVLNPICEIAPWFLKDLCRPQNVYDGAELVGTDLLDWNVGQGDPETLNVRLGDGDGVGAVSAIQSILTRGTDKVISLFNTGFSLCNSSYWPDPGVDSAKTQECMGPNVPAWFGLQALGNSYASVERDPKLTQLFESAGFGPLVTQLQANMAAGKTAVAKVELTTVANGYWGIAAGRQVTLLLFYLTSSPVWEAQLPFETQAELEKGRTTGEGLYKSFPYYSALGENALGLSAVTGAPGLTALYPEQINLLASLTAWAVKENKDLVLDMYA